MQAYQFRQANWNAVGNHVAVLLANAGLKQVHVKREHKATEAAIEAGHLSRKSVSKQQKKERQTARKGEGSLREDNGAFVGVLSMIYDI